ncbi:MAG TPA: glucose-6-phosphate dehydrogenase assembly protein OpcA, partial [Vicinamibacterales bacterium]
MATAVGNRMWKESAPEAVDRDLAALWREVSGRGTIARAVMSNLVVIRLNERRSVERATPSERRDSPDPPDRFAPPDLEAVVARHPSRTIVLEQDRGVDEPRRPVAARVGISVFGPPAAQYGVEWVVLRSACAKASWPSVVRRFALGDVPTSIWWTDDLSSAPEIAPLVATGRQLLYDSRRWPDVAAGLRILAPHLYEGRVDLADLNWRRLTPLRIALVRGGFKLGTSDARPKPCSLDRRILYRPGELALATLLDGWVATRFGSDADKSPTIAEENVGGDVLRLELGEGNTRLVARLGDERLEIEQSGTASLLSSMPKEADAETIAAELRRLAMDRALRDTLLSLA